MPRNAGSHERPSRFSGTATPAISAAVGRKSHNAHGVAFVVPADPTDPPDLEALRSWCRERIADYKAPERLVVVDALPVTSMMKVDKRALAALAEEER